MTIPMDHRPSRKKPARAIPLAAILLVAGGVAGSLLVVAGSIWFCWSQWQKAFPPTLREQEMRPPAAQAPMLWLPPFNPADHRVNQGERVQQSPPARANETPELSPVVPNASELSSPLVPPLELRPVKLAYKHQIGSRPLLLQSWLSATKPTGAGVESVEQCATQIRFLETTEAIDTQGLAGTRLSYRDYACRGWVDGQALPGTPSLPLIRQNLHNLAVNLRVDSQGNLVDFQTDTRSAPPSFQSTWSLPQQEIERWFRALTIPLPNKLVSPGDSWRTEKDCPILRADNRSERSIWEMTYSFQGARNRAGREEAVLALKGRPRREPNLGLPSPWQAEGRAVIDVEFGQVAEVDIRILGPRDVKSVQSSKPIADSLVLRLRRAIPEEEGRGPHPLR